MLFGAALVITWLILLIRYPTKALPVSMAALVGLGLVATWVIWQESRDERYLAHLELRLHYDPQRCPADRPLAIDLKNGSDAACISTENSTSRIGDESYAHPINQLPRNQETPKKV